MASDRLSTALARLDRALARLETAARAPAARDDLARRHEALRAATREAMDRLDRLIAAEGDA